MRTIPSFVMFGVAKVDAGADQLIYPLTDNPHGPMAPVPGVVFAFRSARPRLAARTDRSIFKQEMCQ